MPFDIPSVPIVHCKPCAGNSTYPFNSQAPSFCGVSHEQRLLGQRGAVAVAAIQLPKCTEQTDIKHLQM